MGGGGGEFSIPYLEPVKMLVRAHVDEGIARSLHKLDDIVGPDGAAVLNTVEQLGIVDEDGELGAAKLLGTVRGGVPAVHRRHQQVRVGEVVSHLLQHASGLPR